jgi:formylglycine-generating enzyme required for sulfatase activity
MVSVVQLQVGRQAAHAILAFFVATLLVSTTAAQQKSALEVPNAAAASEKEMKPYTEIISGTQAAFDMVPIPGGTFLMGSPEGEPARKADEGPQVQVQIEPFWMGKHEVTWDAYEIWSFKLDVQRRTFAGIKPTALDPAADALTRPTAPYTDMTFGMGKEGFPAICMTQLAAKRYCEWLSAKTGRYYRLPTEAEWEYACRAGTKTAYSFGDDPEKLGEYAWYFDNSNEAYHKVGLKKPNPWGLHDMHGNVAEHVLDRYDPNLYKTLGGAAANPYNPPKELENRAVRGGSWDDDPEALRSAARRGSTKEWKVQDPQIPQSQWYYTDALFCGFRVVRPLREPDDAEKAKFAPDKIQVYKEQ